MTAASVKIGYEPSFCADIDPARFECYESVDFLKIDKRVADPYISLKSNRQSGSAPNGTINQ